MNIFKISWKNLKTRPLSTALSLLLLSASVGIITLLLLFKSQLEEKLFTNAEGIDMVVGAKGSPLQLILANVYHIDNPTGNIPLKEANRLRRNPYIKTTIPLAYGDNYRGYRILGTNRDYLVHYNGKLEQGKWLDKSFQAVIGAKIAESTGLKIGDKFAGSHGFDEEGEVHADKKYVVVGILKPANNILDQLILTNIESVWEVHEHGEHDDDNHKHEEEEHQEHTHDEGEHDDEEHHHHDDEHDEADTHEEKEITAMLVKFQNPMGHIVVPRMVNANTSMQSASPAIEIDRLFRLLGFGFDAINAIAIAIMFLSGVSVFISLYQSMKDRKYELALIRSLGGSRLQLFLLLLSESGLLVVVGYTIGFLFSRVGLYILSVNIKSSFHYDISTFIISGQELELMVSVLLMGFLAALLPASQAYKTDISKTLSDG